MFADILKIAGCVCCISLFTGQAKTQHWNGPNETIPQAELQTLLDRIDMNPIAFLNFLNSEARQAVTQEVIEWSRDNAVGDSDDAVKLARRTKFEQVTARHVSAVRTNALHWDGTKTAEGTFSCVIPFRAGAKKIAQYVSLMGADNDNFLYQASVAVEYETGATAPHMIGLDGKPKYIKRATVGLVLTAAGAKEAGEVSSSSAIKFGRGRHPDGNSCHFSDITFVE